MTMPVCITVIGSINLDIVATATRLPLAGETITGASLAYHPGGKGANQAFAARKLGAQVSMVGCVGSDSAADQALSLLADHGVSLEDITRIAGAATGVALIAVGQNGENQIVVAPGANEKLTPDYIPSKHLSADATICQLEIPIPTIEAIADRASGFFAINLAPAAPISRAVLTRADLIIVNESEAAFYGDALKNLPGMVVVTLGAKGARMYHSNGEAIEVLPPRVQPVDTTGAGDTFVGALVLALLEGQSREGALAFACAAGAAATLSPGAQPAMPDLSAVLALMDTGAIQSDTKHT